MPRKRERKVKSWSLGHPVLRCLWDAPLDVRAKKSELEGSLWSEEGYSMNVPKGGREAETETLTEDTEMDPSETREQS